jgi:hypothetical protein
MRPHNSNRSSNVNWELSKNHPQAALATAIALILLSFHADLQQFLIFRELFTLWGFCAATDSQTNCSAGAAV